MDFRHPYYARHSNTYMKEKKPITFYKRNVRAHHSLTSRTRIRNFFHYLPYFSHFHFPTECMYGGDGGRVHAKLCVCESSKMRLFLLQ